MNFLDRVRQAVGLAPIFKAEAWRPLVAEIDRLEPFFSTLADESLRERWESCGPGWRKAFPAAPPLAEALALAREAARRALGLRAYSVQLLGAIALIRGGIAEMATGEGKTLAAALAAACLALKGEGVHVATVNRYLAQRDAERLAPFFALLGLRVGLLVEQAEPAAKAEAYAADITYGTGYEFGFDYLRDQLRLHLQAAEPLGAGIAGRLMGREVEAEALSIQRIAPFAIVDEIDSVLIDEAVTPLIISPGRGRTSPEAPLYGEADRVAAALAGDDFEIDGLRRDAVMTAAGLKKLYGTGSTRAFPELKRAWHWYIEQALRARHCFERDVHYLVRDGRIEIIDEYTGRSFTERKWKEGLHQAVEAKERVDISPESAAEVSISRQAFYKRYPHLCGMTGTASESAAELKEVYALSVVPIPRHRPDLLRLLSDRVFRGWEEKIAAMAAEIMRRHESGQPILVGTRTVLKSEELASRLQSLGLEVCLLNARQDSAEAELIGHAGEAGRITIATNMAGRGADIVLGPGAEQRGGLFVLGQERHESGRVDRQLSGRSGRQGSPGEAQFFLSADDFLLEKHGQPEAETLRGLTPGEGGELPSATAALFRQVQQRAELEQLLERRALMARDAKLESLKRHFQGAGE